jgi:RNA polymerase sigma-70 factor (ECF subfamily)
MPEIDSQPSEFRTLLDGVRQSDERAFRALFDALYAPLRRFAFSLVRDDLAAEDLVQDAFIRLWDRRERLDAELAVRAYLFRIVRNLALNSARDDATRRRLLDDPIALESAAVPRGFASPDDASAGEDLSARLSGWLEELPPRQREALLLSRVEGLSHAEVATAMGCAPRTVNNHLVAALQTLRRRLAGAGALVASMWGMLS